MDEKLLQELLDREAIRDNLMRYSRAVDRHDAAAMEAVYWPDAYDYHLLFEGAPAKIVEASMSFTRGMPTQHFLGQMLVETTGPGRAFSETYYQAYHNMPGASEADDRRDLTLLGRYLDTHEKREGEWRIVRRIIAVDAYHDQPGSQDWAAGIVAGIRPRGGHKPHDPLYAEHPLIVYGAVGATSRKTGEAI